MTGGTSRVAIVTGGASGIGLGIGRQLAADGHAVALFDLDGDAAAAAAEGLRSEGATALGVSVDVADRAAVDAGVARVRDELGPIGILVTSAGIESFLPVGEITAEVWDRIIAVNLTGTHRFQQATDWHKRIPAMADA